MLAGIEFVIGALVGAGVVALNGLIRADAPRRHARYRLRAKLARWVLEGRVSPAKVTHGKLSVPSPRAKRAAKRHKVLSVVRRDDAAASGTEQG